MKSEGGAMNQQALPSPREHHFYVATAKFLFHHPEHGIVSVRDPIKIKDAERYGLSPLILYGLTVAGLPIRWMTFTPFDQPRAFRDVLLEAWRNAAGLRGRPDILRVNRHLALASPELVRDMAKIEVRVEVAGAKEKSLPASLRSAQDSSRWLMGKHDRKDRSLAGSILALCRDAQYDYGDEDDDFWAESDYDNAAEVAKNLVACWPNPPAEIAECAGITLRELQWFTSGKAPLDQHARFSLEGLLGIKYDESRGGYVGAGPYVLMAHKPLALKEVYEAVSKGGDARPCEIIPRQGAADPSWRYVLIDMYGEPPSIVMSPRGAKITERLPDLLLNYAGITPVSPEFYRDVVSTCARACREPAANIREMTDFAKRYEGHWVSCARQPE